MTIEMKLDQKYEQGKTEGMKIGKTEGEQHRDKVLILKWLEKGKTVKEIAEDLDKSEDYVKSFMQILKQQYRQGEVFLENVHK